MEMRKLRSVSSANALSRKIKLLVKMRKKISKKMKMRRSKNLLARDREQSMMTMISEDKISDCCIKARVFRLIIHIHFD